MNAGIVLLLIVAFGYLSNWLNGRYLNYKITHFLHYIGALVHETSHALLCILTGAKIEEFKVFVSQPHVIHKKSKLPYLGELLISSAPIAGGLLFLFLINHYLLGNYFAFNQFNDLNNWQNIFIEPFKFLSQINLLEWQSWAMILLFINIGAMISPSLQDLKNVWPLVIVLFFLKLPILIDLGLAALSLIFVNIVIQIVLILFITVTKRLTT